MDMKTIRIQSPSMLYTKMRRQDELILCQFLFYTDLQTIWSHLGAAIRR